ncbi:hypothetical protein J6590_007358 [Homalodisca vitripennis]|nr:hypothetical protein J6590_007358 [Homalodisca vitripennis]
MFAEKRRRQRNEEYAGRRKTYQKQSPATKLGGFVSQHRTREDSTSNLLAAAEPIDTYQSNADESFSQDFTPTRIGDPPRGLFDDI